MEVAGTKTPFVSLYGLFSSLYILKPVRTCIFAGQTLDLLINGYTFTVQEPLDPLDSHIKTEFDEWEIALYVLSLSFAIEGYWPLLSSLLATNVVEMSQNYTRYG
jgi:hypothetical protein